MSPDDQPRKIKGFRRWEVSRSPAQAKLAERAKQGAAGTVKKEYIIYGNDNTAWDMCNKYSGMFGC